MLSHAFCNSSQRLSFECTADVSSLFSNSPQICSTGLRSGLWGTNPSFSVFQQIPSIADSSGFIFVLFYGFYNGKFNKNNWNLLNPSAHSSENVRYLAQDKPSATVETKATCDKQWSAYQRLFCSVWILNVRLCTWQLTVHPVRMLYCDRPCK